MTKRPDIGAMFGASATETFLGLPRAGILGRWKPDRHPGRALRDPLPIGRALLRRRAARHPRCDRRLCGQLHHVDFDLGGPIFPDGVVAVDGGDLACTAADPSANRAVIREAVATVLARGAVPIVIGGDDSMPIPVVEAFQGRGPLTIVQIDAHIDWRDEVAGERFGLSSTMRRASEMPHIERIVQVGQRAIGSARPATSPMPTRGARSSCRPARCTRTASRRSLTPCLPDRRS